MGAIAKYDWKKLHRDWEKTTGLTLQDFCEARELNYTNTSRQFQKIDDANSLDDKRETAKILSKNGVAAANKLASLTNSEDEGIALKASTANLGMIGFSAQAGLQVNTTVNVSSLGFFVQADADDTKALFQGEPKVIEQE